MVTAARWPTSTACPSSSSPATSSPTAAPTRCCNRSRISATAPSAPTTASAPVSRYFDRITRPEQLLTALPRALRTMTDPADCGPVTLAFCQDVQARRIDWPGERSSRPGSWRQPPSATPTADELEAPSWNAHPPRPKAPRHRRRRRRPLLRTRLRGSCAPLPSATEHPRRSKPRPASPLYPGTTRSTSAPSASPARPRPPTPTLPRRRPRPGASAPAFRTSPPARGSLFRNPMRPLIVAINIAPYDGEKRGALPVMRRREARQGGTCHAPRPASAQNNTAPKPVPDARLKRDWLAECRRPSPPRRVKPTRCRPTSQVIGAVQRAGHHRHTVIVSRRRHHARRTPEALEGRPAHAPTTWNTAFPAWATRSRAPWASRWPNPSAT
jgi:3D-(3,5/4)-trihydroxycyclohexane-1,2-dione acylhydrolase (decyclizing)